MACLQPPCLSSLNPKLSTPKPTLFSRTHFLKPFTISSFADSSPYPTHSLSTSGQNPVGTAAIGDDEEGAKKIPDAVRVAMEKAREYKRNKGLGEVQVISEVVQNPIEPANEDDGEETTKIPDRVRIAMEKAREYKRNRGLVGGGGEKIGEGQVISKVGRNQTESANGDVGDENKKVSETVMITLERPREYKKNKGLVGVIGEDKEIGEDQIVQNPIEPANEGAVEETEKIPDRVRIAMEKAREYKRNRGLVGCGREKIGEGQVISEAGRNQIESANGDVGDENKKVSETVMITLERPREYNKNKGLVEVIGDDQVGQSPNEPGDENEESPKIPDRVRIAMEKAREYKKNKGLVKEARVEHANGDLGRRAWPIPVEVRIGMERAREHMKKKGFVTNGDNEVITGLNGDSILEAFPDDYYPEVEIIVGDVSKFGNETSVGQIVEEERGERRSTPKLSRWVE